MQVRGLHVVGCCVVVLVHVVLTSLVPSLAVGVFGADLSTGVGKAEFVGAFTEDATMRAFAQHLCAQAGDSDDWAASDSDSDDGDMAAPASTAAAALVDPNAVLFGGDLAAACWDVMRRCLAKEKPGAAALYLALMASVQRLGTNDHALSAANLALAFRYCAMASSRHPGSLLLGRDFTAATHYAVQEAMARHVATGLGGAARAYVRDGVAHCGRAGTFSLLDKRVDTEDAVAGDSAVATPPGDKGNGVQLACALHTFEVPTGVAGLVASRGSEGAGRKPVSLAALVDAYTSPELDNSDSVGAPALSVARVWAALGAAQLAQACSDL